VSAIKSWQSVSLGSVVQLINGDRGKNYPSQKDFINDGIPFINAGHLKEGSVEFESMNYISQEKFNVLGSGKVQHNDILYCLRGSLGKTAIIQDIDKGAIASSLVIIRPSKDITTKYLFYFLTSNLGQAEIYKYDNGSTQPNLSAASVKAYQIPLPPLEEQKRIAAILDKADRVRRKRQEAIQLTEELGRSIFLDMFGDPVTNPKGWEVAPLSKFGEVFTGNTPPRADLENYGDCIEWIKSDNITTPYHFLTEASEKLSSIGKKKGRVVPSGSILVCCIAGSKSSIGRAAIADREVAFNQQINAVVPNKSVDAYFLYSHFWIAQNLVQSESTDSMKGLVNKSKFSGIHFLKPPLSKQIEFREKFLRFIDINKSYETSLRESENLFNSLLQRAFRGEL
jgi:type I restriction enzyme, S subunit